MSARTVLLRARTSRIETQDKRKRNKVERVARGEEKETDEVADCGVIVTRVCVCVCVCRTSAYAAGLTLVYGRAFRGGCVSVGGEGV